MFEAGVLAFALSMPFRADRGLLKKPKRLDDGRVIVEGVLTRSGVFSYRNDDGSERREYRPPEEVFKADSMQSFALVPVTDNHPNGMVTAQSVKDLAVGTVGENVRRDDNFMVASMAINSADAVAKLDQGKTALSCGYIVDLEEVPGTTPSGEKYDAIQRNIRGNHVALVDVGRAGPEARIRMDGAAFQTEKHEDPRMDEKLIETLEKLAAEKARADEAEAKLAEAIARADRAEAERDAAKDAQAEADKSRADQADRFDAAVAARVKLESTARDVLGEEFKCDGKTDREIKVAVCKVDCEGKSDDYVQARFDAALDAHAEGKKEQKIYAGMKPAAEVERADDGEDKEEAARKRMEEDQANAWKEGK